MLKRSYKKNTWAKNKAKTGRLSDNKPKYRKYERLKLYILTLFNGFLKPENHYKGYHEHSRVNIR